MERSGRFQHQLPPLEVSPKPNFRVVIAYEDLAAGKNARHTYDYVAHQLGYDCQFTNEMWNFDVLGIPRLREMAARDAVHADMIIIACHGDRPLPDSLKSWIELWMSEEVNSIALVTLFDPAHLSTPVARAIREYLAQVAQRANMEFFTQTGPGPDHNHGGGLLKALPTWTQGEVNDRLSA